MNLWVCKGTDWVLTLENEKDPAIRALLLRTLVDDDLLSIAALFWTQICWAASLLITGWAWLVVPMAVDVMFFALRWRIRHRPVPANDPESSLTDRSAVALNILWISLIALEVVVLFQVPSLRTTALGIILPIGFIGYVSSLYAGFPRLAVLNIALLNTGLTIGLATSHLADLHILALLSPCAGVAFTILMRRTHGSLLDAIRAQRRNHHESRHDPLTGLANRTLMMERLHRACASSRRPGQDGRIGVLCLDLDGFKGINDRFGHAIGDRVLVEVANRLRASVRPGDTVCRLGGDEYVVLLPAVEEIPLRSVGERIVAAVAEPIGIGAAAPVHVGVSIGLAHEGPEGTAPEDLLARADAALYSAKRGGKGRLRAAS